VANAVEANSIDSIREMQLKDHLVNPNAAAKTAISKEDLTKLAQEDFQLYESMNILQAMALGNAKQ
jgi:formate-dependent phosphoribosylglycinamide formyltransferase (GAR transformylase)